MSDAEDTESRADALKDLIHLRVSMEEAKLRLRRFDWDAAPNLVSLAPDAVIDVLSRFAAGEVASNEVERWADAIEGRDDIELPPLYEPVLGALIFELANPEITRPLTVESARGWMDSLRGNA